MQQTSTQCFPYAVFLPAFSLSIEPKENQAAVAAVKPFLLSTEKKEKNHLLSSSSSLSVCVERVRTFVQAAILTSNVLFLNIYRHEDFTEI